MLVPQVVMSGIIKGGRGSKVFRGVSFEGVMIGRQGLVVPDVQTVGRALWFP